MTSSSISFHLEDESAKAKLPNLLKLVDQEKSNLVQLLKEAVAIPSIAHEPEHFSDIVQMINFCKKELISLGAKVNVINNDQEKEKTMSPVLFATLIADELVNHKTICVYGCVDMAPLKKSKQESNSSQLTEKNGRLYGCGVSQNKGPLTCWLNALKVYKKAKLRIPVNIKFVIEGTAESHSSSLKRAVELKTDFFSDVSYVCLTIDKRVDNIPCLKYGFRGIAHFSLEINCGEKKIHTGSYGGAFQQPLISAVNVVGSLFDKDGKISVSEVNQLLKEVETLSLEEDNYCKEFPLDVQKLKEKIGTKHLKHKEKNTRLLIHKTRLPSISVHNFDMVISCDNKHSLALVPNKVTAKFSVRLVPNQTAEETYQILDNHIRKIWEEHNNVNSYTFKMDFGYDPWKETPSSPNYKAAADAIKMVYNRNPLYVCEGYMLPALSVMAEACYESDLLVLPLSSPPDHAHSTVESISLIDYINGIKLLIAYMCEIHDME